MTSGKMAPLGRSGLSLEKMIPNVSNSPRRSRSNGRWVRKDGRRKRGYKSPLKKAKKQEFDSRSDIANLTETEESSSPLSSVGRPNVERIEYDQSGDQDGIEISIADCGTAMELVHVISQFDNSSNQPAPRSHVVPSLPVHFASFSTNFTLKIAGLQITQSDSKATGRHRVPLQSRQPQPVGTSASPKRIKEKRRVLSLLENHSPPNEEAAIKDELKKCTAEIESLERDLQNILRSLHTDESAADAFFSCSNDHHASGNSIQWDVDAILDQSPETSGSKQKWYKRLNRTPIKRASPRNTSDDDTPTVCHITWEQRRCLQRKRGTFFHSTFEDPVTRYMFASKCGGDKHGSVHNSLKECGSPSAPNAIKVAACGANVRHFAITSGPLGTSFFLSKDNEKAFWDGNIPARLIDRISLQPRTPNIRYLSTGPDGSYYAELWTGECWWGISLPDEKFHEVMNLFDVHRVAFGPFTVGDDKDQFMTETSWVVTGKDGRIAWRNIPSRLEQLFLNRSHDMAAPCEISLGAEESYFVKFLDGEIDYCLSASAADVCESILHQGAVITNIALHPELPHDYIIRHSRLT